MCELFSCRLLSWELDCLSAIFRRFEERNRLGLIRRLMYSKFRDKQTPCNTLWVAPPSPYADYVDRFTQDAFLSLLRSVETHSGNVAVFDCKTFAHSADLLTASRTLWLGKANHLVSHN